MNNPATAEVWQPAFGKDFGGMCQGDNKTGQKGSNAMFVMTHNKIAHAAAIKTLMQQVPHADTAIARDLVSAFGPLLYGPHSY